MEASEKIKRTVLIGLCMAALAPAMALIMIKPFRVVTPQVVNSVNCYSGGICTDDDQRLDEARVLYSAALSLVSQKAGAFHSRPKVIFCSADSCRGSFGLGSRAAYTVGDFGIVIAPRGWQTFFLAHEFIHYRQAEEFGNIKTLFKPTWLIEGMAYSLSDDPRRPLTQPFESWCVKFESWDNSTNITHFWQAARKVK